VTAARSGARRLLHIAVVLCRHVGGHLVDLLLARVARVLGRARPVRLSGPVRLRMMLEELGGSFIKLGQMLALQPDIVSLECCNALFTLLDMVTPFEYERVRETFQEELGEPPEVLFDTFDPNPLATASVGQVHVATLGGRTLAVKVRRPNVEQDFAGDIRLITTATALIRRARLRRLYWLLDPLDEFVAWTHEELDYRIEARYMDRLRQNANGRPEERIPEVFWPYTTRRTLVAEFLDGVTVLAILRSREAPGSADAARLRKARIDTQAVARNIIANFLGTVFRHGMFHADLHPANLIVLPGNAIGYIDFGITGVISAYSRRNLVALTLAYTSGDLDGMAEAFFRVCRMTDDDSPRVFRSRLAQLDASWYDRQHGSCRLRKNFTLVMLDMLRLSRHSGVWPDRDVIKYIRSAIAIDGLITRMSPSFDISHYLAAVCADHLREHMRQSFLTYAMLVDIAAAGGRMFRDGVARGAAAMERFADTGMAGAIQLRQDQPDPEERWRRETVALGAIALVASTVGAQAGDTTLGVNVFTAALIVVALATVKLGRAFSRISGGARLAGR
jgi:ubiquinone biosynthesis protein